MQAIAGSAFLVAVFNLAGGEIILILALVLILFGAKMLPDLGRGLRRGMFEFRQATKPLTDTIDKEASEAGESAGGIYGKRAAQALTPDNQVAELYNPGIFEREDRSRKRRMRGFLLKLWQIIRMKSLPHRIYKVESLQITGPYTLILKFDDQTEQIIDFKPVLAGELYGPLRDLSLFNQVKIDPEVRTLVWPNGADFDPETLHDWPTYSQIFAARARQWESQPA
jgi:TatA/E family protein of Tat protein translocase